MQAESRVYSSELGELQVWKEAEVAVSSATAGDGNRCPGERQHTSARFPARKWELE